MILRATNKKIQHDICVEIDILGTYIIINHKLKTQNRNKSTLAFGEWFSSLLHITIDFTIVAKFNNQVDIVCIFKIAKQLKTLKKKSKYHKFSRDHNKTY